MVELPEFALFLCRNSRGCCLPCEFVAIEWKVFEDKFYVLGVFLQHLLEERLKPPTEWSLVITEDNNGNRGVLRTLKGGTGNIDLAAYVELDYLKQFL